MRKSWQPVNIREESTMLTLSKEQAIKKLESNISMLLNKHQIDEATVYEQTDVMDIIKLGYQIKHQNNSYLIYLRYMTFSSQTLIPFAPIWTVEHLHNPLEFNRGFDNIANCFAYLAKKTYQKRIS